MGTVTWTPQVTDVFLESGMMIEGFKGYDSRISDMNWTYNGTDYKDAQPLTIPQTISYGRKGSLWKTFTIGHAHPDYHLPRNKGTGVSIDDSFSRIDVQASHSTIGQFKSQVEPELPWPCTVNVQYLRAAGS